MREVQSILFDRKYYNISKAKKWLKKHGHKYDKVDVKPDHLRFRQINPKKFKGFFTQHKTKTIKFVIGTS